jgi:hypothetical protein
MEKFGDLLFMEQISGGKDENFRRKLFGTKKPFDTVKTDELFLLAVKENCRYQYRHCDAYRKILDGMGFYSDSIEACCDVAEIPFLPTLFFKIIGVFLCRPVKSLLKRLRQGLRVSVVQ